jgi:hypothetical protein
MHEILNFLSNEPFLNSVFFQTLAGTLGIILSVYLGFRLFIRQQALQRLERLFVREGLEAFEKNLSTKFKELTESNLKINSVLFDMCLSIKAGSYEKKYLLSSIENLLSNLNDDESVNITTGLSTNIYNKIFPDVTIKWIQAFQEDRLLYIGNAKKTLFKIMELINKEADRKFLHAAVEVLSDEIFQVYYPLSRVGTLLLAIRNLNQMIARSYFSSEKHLLRIYKQSKFKKINQELTKKYMDLFCFYDLGEKRLLSHNKKVLILFDQITKHNVSGPIAVMSQVDEVEKNRTDNAELRILKDEEILVMSKFCFEKGEKRVNYFKEMLISSSKQKKTGAFYTNALFKIKKFFK